MPGLVDVRLDPCFATGSIPGMLAVRFCAERRSLQAQKQGDGMQINYFALCQGEILVEGGVRRIKHSSFAVKIAPEQLRRLTSTTTVASSHS